MTISEIKKQLAATRKYQQSPKKLTWYPTVQKSCAEIEDIAGRVGRGLAHQIHYNIHTDSYLLAHANPEKEYFMLLSQCSLLN